jgi:hypoxanthine phosphoribosyltransferase
VLHNKKKEKRGKIPTEVHRYFAGEELDDKWICYPWDAQDITAHEKISNSGMVAY